MQPTATHKHAMTATLFWRQKKAVLSQSRYAQLSAAAVCRVEAGTAPDGGENELLTFVLLFFDEWKAKQRPY